MSRCCWTTGSMGTTVCEESQIENSLCPSESLCPRSTGLRDGSPTKPCTTRSRPALDSRRQAGTTPACDPMRTRTLWRPEMSANPQTMRVAWPARAHEIAHSNLAEIAIETAANATALDKPKRMQLQHKQMLTASLWIRRLAVPRLFASLMISQSCRLSLRSQMFCPMAP